MASDERTAQLIAEYRTILGPSDGRSDEGIQDVLVRGADWTAAGAKQLLQLARTYGSFMLSNALALSVALDIEDGTAGY